MPNWCKNAMLVTGEKEQVEKFIEKMKTQESDFDFNSVIPMPPTLSVESSSTAEKAYAVYYGDRYQKQRALGVDNDQDFDKEFQKYDKEPQHRQLAETYHFNKSNYGFTTWYEWCSKIWGTKWNASDVNKGDLIQVGQSNIYQVDYFFETAWSFPQGIYEQFAQDYPQLVFSIDVDEEGGFFWGNLTIKDGQIIEDLQEGTRPGGPYDYGDEDEE